MNLEKKLQKSRLGEAYAGIHSDADRQAVLRAYDALLKENDLSNKMLARHMAGSILPSIAMYRGLQEQGWKPVEARRLIRTSVLNASKPMAKFFQGLGKLPFFFPLFRVMCPASTKGGFGPEGWQFEWKRNDAYAIEWDCHACLYAHVFRRYGVPELTPIFCESDDVMYGKIPGARWGRTKTIGRGDELCNFRFTNTRRENQDEEQQ